MSTTKRAAARTMGLRLAARVATVGGIAVAALGLVEARAAGAATAPHVASGEPASSDDARPLPMEGWAKASAGFCGCAPCWGPPAPPVKSASRRGRTRRGTRTTRARRSSRGGR